MHMRKETMLLACCGAAGTTRTHCTLEGRFATCSCLLILCGSKCHLLLAAWLPPSHAPRALGDDLTHHRTTQLQLFTSNHELYDF
jgi:hypothetical protein